MSLGKKILFDCLHLRNSSTGVDMYSLNLISNILLQDSENHYIILVNKRFNVNTLQSYIPSCSKNVTIKRLWANLPLQAVISSLLMPIYLRWNRIDVYHQHFFFGPLYRWICTDTRIIITVHDMFHWVIPDLTPSLVNWLLTTFSDRSMGVADLIIAVSSTTKRDITQHISSVEAKRVHTIFLGCSDRFNAKEADSSILSDLGLLEKKYILYVGYIIPKKGMDDLLEGYKVAIDKLGLKDHLLIIAGKPDPDYVGKLLKTVSESTTLRDKVKILGYVSNDTIVTLYAKATVFVHPAHYEGFGLPVLEAMKMKCPVIARNSSSLTEVVADSGLLFDTKEQMSQQIYDVCTDDELRNTLIDKGVQRANDFSWTTTASKTLSLYTIQLD